MTGPSGRSWSGLLLGLGCAALGIVLLTRPFDSLAVLAGVVAAGSVSPTTWTT